MEVVRFYVNTPGRVMDRHNPVGWRIWQPVQSANRCLSFTDLGAAERALRYVIRKTWTSGMIWKAFPDEAREFYTDFKIPPGTVYAPDSLAYMQGRVPKTPPASCVCVAVAFYPDPDWDATEAVTVDPRGDGYSEPAMIRDTRVFVGVDGKPPDGPRFGDLKPLSDDALLQECVLQFAALSGIG